jgi:PAS domain S-box-containing protein
VNQLAKYKKGNDTQEFLNRILSALPDAILVFDSHYGIIYANILYAELVGLNLDSIIGKTLIEIGWSENTSSTLENIVKKVIDSGNGDTVEIDFLTMIGLRHYEFVAQPLLENDGIISYVLVVAHDITERITMESALTQSVSRYRTLFEEAPISLWEEDASGSKYILDQLKEQEIRDYDAYFKQHPETVVALLNSLKVIDVNKATLDLFEAESKEELVKRLPQTFTEEAFIHTGVALASYGLGLTGFKFETTNRTLKGNIIHISIRSLIPPGYETTLSRIFFAMDDITERKRIENGLKKSSTELNKRSKDLQTLLDISLDMASGLNLDELMYKIAKYAAELLGGEAAAVGLIKEDTQAVVYPFVFHLPETFKRTEIPPSIGLTGEVITNKKPIILEDYQQYADRIPDMAELGLRSIIMVPLLLRGVPIGTIWVSRLSSTERFYEEDVIILEGLGRHAAIAVQNAKQYEAERHIADTLQESLLVMPSQIEGVEFGHLYHSATVAAKVGGDFYDLFEIERGKIGIVIGDISGKGIEAATLTSIAKSTIKAHSFENGTPAQVMSKVNDMMVRVSTRSSFITVFFGVLDIFTGSLIYCSAGHPPQLIKRAQNSVSILDANSPIIGAFKKLPYVNGIESLKRNDRLILYTDGITEARRDNEFFGEERLREFIDNLQPISTEETPLAIFRHIIDWTGGKLLDDIALLSVSFSRNNP